MSESEPTCAVWYYRHGVVYYELREDERSAAVYAYHLTDSGDGAVVGVQFADGRFTKEQDWAALAEYEKEEWARFKAVLDAEALNPSPPRLRRKVRLPWPSPDTAQVDPDDPDWLGA